MRVFLCFKLELAIRNNNFQYNFLGRRICNGLVKNCSGQVLWQFTKFYSTVRLFRLYFICLSIYCGETS